MFPYDKYTPHGYLDNPAYAWIKGQGGVIRSRPAIGMEWHYPALPAGYNRLRQYRTGLRFAFIEAGKLLLDSADYRSINLKLHCDYHSKNVMRFVLALPNGLQITVSYFLADAEQGDGLAAILRLENQSSQTITTSFGALLDYECEPQNIRTWLSGLYTKSTNAGLTIGEWQEGVKVHLASSQVASRNGGFSGNSALLDVFIGKNSSVNAAVNNPWQREMALIYDLVLEAGVEQEIRFGLVRATTEFNAVKAAAALVTENAGRLQEILTARLAEDKKFWRNSPRLRGNWPDYVRRGLVYDLETLRMMVRRPLGIYKHKWDAMQLQAPRTVLGEAAIDMAILAYADPEAAKEVLLGTFADAPEANVPCSREDGSYNMVASDGSPCGTAPEWCFPFHCINLVYQQTGDKKWLTELYPLLEDFVGWWISHRSNEQGLPFYKCSWEAGQDNSPRFEIQDDPSGGGALTEHLWPVDLQAALAQCCLLLAYWASELGQDGQRWQLLGTRYAELTRRMWLTDKNWFHDYDTRASHFTDVLDTMQLAPLLCGVTSPEQREALSQKIFDPPKHGQIFHPLMWPSIAFCLIEAASEGGFHEAAALHSWNALAPVYRWLDSDPLSIESEAGGMPGVGREYWPQVVGPDENPPRGGGGAEVYGWGCLGVMLLCRHIVGLQENFDIGINSALDNRTNVRNEYEKFVKPNQTPSPNVVISDDKLNVDAAQSFTFTLTPGLPDVLLKPNQRYGVGPLHFRQARFNLRYRILDTTGKLEMRLVLLTQTPQRLTIVNSDGGVLYQEMSGTTRLHRVRLNLSNHQSVLLQFV